jgi:uncharacterized protein
MASTDYPLQFAFKVASRCNLNCSYCYVYNKGDMTWQSRPAIMSEAVFSAALNRIRHHCIRSGQQSVKIVFHGGEPCLAGSERFSTWCYLAKKTLGDLVRIDLSIQTNGTLLDDGWIEVFQLHDVKVGVSLDGPKEIHDVFRVDHQGRGSYDAVARGLSLLREADIPLKILSVIQLGADPLLAHRHFVSLGANYIDYLLPDFTHDTIGPIRERYGPTPCADYLISIFDDWWFNGTLDLIIGLFWNIGRLILGGNSETDLLGNQPFRFVFVESNGAIEGLDVLRVCKEGIAKVGLNVLTHDFHHIAKASSLHREAIFDGVPLPSACNSCPERDTCSGGYLPHRYSTEHAFNNPTVWCEDLLSLFGHIRKRLNVSTEETNLRKQILHELAIESPASASSQN